MKPDSDAKPEQNSVASNEYSSHPEPIAVVGMECIFPGAANLGEYWKNIINGTSAVREVPPSRWNPIDYDLKAAHGAFIDGLTELDPLALGIMPAAVDEGDPEQFLVFSVIYNALRDAEHGRSLCRGEENIHKPSANSDQKPRRGELLFAIESPERTEVVVGRGGGYLGNSAEAGYLRMEGIAQIIDLLRETSPHLSPEEIKAIRDRLVEALPRQTAETVASVVPNVTSGRVANRLNFMGANYIVDAACASSLIAVDHAVRSLRERRCDLGIAAGVNISQKPHFWYAFEKLNALSASGTSRPYSSDADGLIIGEGIGAVVLKRLSDAQRDGDRIYALIRGVGVSSDGRGTGVMTPRLEGQVLALQRAYQESGVDPQSVSLIEGHGTGTPVGDATEIDTLHAVFGREGYPAVALGSVKSMIGHTMPAAGLAGIIKTALALHHRVLPPTINVDQVHPALKGSRIYVNTQTRPWINAPEARLRAAVNAFGFGGVNAHIVLEAAPREAPVVNTAEPVIPRICGDLTPRSSELFVTTADTREALLQRITLWSNALPKMLRAELRDAAYTESLHCTQNAPFRLAIVARDIDDLTTKLSHAGNRLQQDASASWTEPDGTYFRGAPYDGKVAILFPGIGFPGLAAGYTQRIAELCLHFPEVRQSIEFANATCPPDDKMPYPMHHQFFPPPLLEPEAFARIERELAWSTRTTHGMMAANLATWYLVRSMGIRPDVVAGFSLGEWSALVAGGVIPVDNLLECANMAMGSYSDEWTDDPDESWGAWGMVVAPAERVEPVLQQIDGTVCITMDISPNQVFIGGEIEAVRAALQKLKAEGIWGQELPFPAVHTPLAGEMVERLKAEKSNLRAQRPQCTIYRGVCGTPYPNDPDQILDLLFDSVTHPVSIRNTVSRLYEDGVRVFIQLGGGGRLLPNIRSTLQGLPHEAVAIDRENRGGLEQFHHMLAQLAVLGVPMTLSTLYQDRPCTQIELGNVGAAKPGRTQVLSLSPPRLRPSSEGVEHIQRTLATPPVVVEKVIERVVELAPAAHFNTMPQSSATPQPRVMAQPPTTQAATAERVLAESMQTMQRFLAIEREQEENETRLLSQYLQAQSSMMSRFLSPAAPIQSAPAQNAPAFADYQNGAQTPCKGTDNGQPQTSLAETSNLAAPYPLLGEIRHLVPGQELDSHLILDLDEHLFLADHSLVRAPRHLKAAEDLLPTLPMTGSIEIIAEAAATLVPRLKVIACHDIEARRWIAMHGQRQLPLHIKARRVAPTQVDVELRVGTEKTPSFRGSVTLGETLPSPPAPLQLVHDEACPHTPQQLYSEGRLFHGPKFQVLKRFHGLSDNSIAADVEVRDQQAMFASPLQRPLIIDPILMDGVGQAVGYRAQLDGSTLFPVRLARVSLHGERPPAGAVLRAEMAYRRVDDRRVEGDIDVYDENGRIWLHIDAWQIWRLLMPPDFQAVTWQPEERCLAVPWPTNDARVTACRVHSKLLGEANLDWLARLYLGGYEWETYQQNPRYDWLLGRIAAKDAVRSRIKKMGGDSLHPLEIRISNLPSGAPVFQAPGGRQWALSISHIKDEAIAAVADAPGVGVDVLRVTQRSPEFMSVAFDTEEKTILEQSGDELLWMHRVWCAKEAIAKAHGVGLEAIPQFRLRQIVAATGAVEIEHTADSKRHRVSTFAENGRTAAISVLDSRV